MENKGRVSGRAKEGRWSPLVRKGRGIGSTRHEQNREGLAVGGGWVSRWLCEQPRTSTGHLVQNEGWWLQAALDPALSSLYGSGQAIHLPPMSRPYAGPGSESRYVQDCGDD